MNRKENGLWNIVKILLFLIGISFVIGGYYLNEQYKQSKGIDGESGATQMENN